MIVPRCIATAVLLCLLNVANANSKHRMYRNDIKSDLHTEKIQNYEHDKCETKNFLKAFKGFVNQAKCQPREAIVHLTSENAEFQMMPSMVVVKRCPDRGCYGKNSCAPTESRQLNVAVRILHYMRPDLCGWVNVTEHTKCECGCNVKSSDCTDLQTYNARDCMCQCKNEYMKSTCFSKGMVWDEITCSCVCYYQTMECSTGTVWVPSMCKCAKVMMDDYEKYEVIN